MNYCKLNNIKSGSVFVTRNNKPLSHNFINKKLKEVASMAKIKKGKIHAHNFRVYFANSYYTKYKDINKLATILGHESIITTFGYLRCYIDECQNDINNL
jgi:site-specific recombinase XerD